MKRNSFVFGAILGLIAPLLAMFGYYYWKFYPTYAPGEFFSVVIREKTLISGIATFSLFANVLLLTLYLNTRRDETAKGIFIVSCVYAIGALILKLTR